MERLAGYDAFTWRFNGTGRVSAPTIKRMLQSFILANPPKFKVVKNLYSYQNGGTRVGFIGFYLSTIDKGNLSEVKIYTRLVELGYKIVFPAHVQRWDIGWEDGDRLIKVQSKTGRIRNGVIRFNSSSRGRTGGSRLYTGQIDYFGVYVPELEKVYLVPISATSRNEVCYLRLDPTKNNQSTRIMWAKDYELQSKLPLPV